jgi:uncharacterized phage-associated protein
MLRAIDVANRLIHLANAEDEPEHLTHLRLQKLLYYVQGWSLGLRNEPAFEGRIEAWAHGPVVREIYPVFADFGKNPINPDEYENPSLDGVEAEFIAEVWEAYKPYSSSSLREMTHNERPWIVARGSCSPTDKCETEITHAMLREFFKELSLRQAA